MSLEIKLQDIETEIAALRKLAQESSQRYRQSGLALSATIIALSIAVMFYSSKSSDSRAPLFGFAIPICASICYQFMHVLAEQARSRSMDSITTVQFEVRSIFKNESNVIDLQRAINKYLRHITRVHGLSYIEDIFCFLSVAVFMVLSAAYVWFAGKEGIAIAIALLFVAAGVLAKGERIPFLKKIYQPSREFEVTNKHFEVFPNKSSDRL